jgi:hypothetical protein
MYIISIMFQKNLNFSSIQNIEPHQSTFTFPYSAVKSFTNLLITIYNIISVRDVIRILQHDLLFQKFIVT